MKKRRNETKRNSTRSYAVTVTRGGARGMSARRGYINPFTELRDAESAAEWERRRAAWVRRERLRAAGNAVCAVFAVLAFAAFAVVMVELMRMDWARELAEQGAPGAARSATFADGGCADT